MFFVTAAIRGGGNPREKLHTALVEIHTLRTPKEIFVRSLSFGFPYVFPKDSANVGVFFPSKPTKSHRRRGLDLFPV
jgi:hypothetical protein